MKKTLLPLAVLIGGVGIGGAAAYGTSMFVRPAAAEEAVVEDTSFVPATDVLAPLVLPDGRLAGYASFEVQLEVGPEDVERVTARLPMLLHAINMRTYRTPMAAGPDGMLPDLSAFRKVVTDASVEAFGKGVVRRAAITKAVPA